MANSNRKINRLSITQQFELCKWLETHKDDRKFRQAGFERVSKSATRDLGFPVSPINAKNSAKITNTHDIYKGYDHAANLHRTKPVAASPGTVGTIHQAVVDIIDCLGSLATPGLMQHRELIANRIAFSLASAKQTKAA